MRYISADALDDAYYELHIHGTIAVKSVLPVFKALLDNAPTADVAEVKHGEWQWFEEWLPSSPIGPAECQSAGWECPECNIDLADYLTETLGELLYIDNPDRRPKLNYCPNCGAKMDGERKTT